MASLLLHIRLKSTVRKHHCDVCHKVFNNYSVMVVHKRFHFGEEPYKCGDCGEGFSCSSRLKTHYKMHKQQNVDVYENYEFDEISLLFNNHGFSQNCLDLKISSQLGTYTGKDFT